MVEVKKTTIWLRKKDAEKPIDGIIKNQGVIMIENKIILIEDDKEIRGMINDYLSGEFEVTAFNDGMSAIQKITSYDEYALALIDLMLPDISGMEIIKIIRKVSKIPIIIITAKDNDIDKSLRATRRAHSHSASLHAHVLLSQNTSNLPKALM